MSGEHRLVATFGDVDRARDAILALGLLAFSGAGVWASAIGGGTAGGAVGGVIGGVSGLGTSGAWQRTYAEVRGPPGLLGDPLPFAAPGAG